MSSTSGALDISAYLTLPRMGIEDAMTLGDALIETAPAERTSQMDGALERIRLTIVEIVDEMVRRLRKAGFSKEDVSFDLFVDGLWALLRGRLEGWARYRHPGATALRGDPEYAIDYAELEARAERAAKLLDQLFANGLDFTRTAYIKQARLTANLLELIERDGLDGQLATLAGPELLPTLQACQRRYDKMVKERLGHEDKGADLRVLRVKLGHCLQLYVSTVIALLGEDVDGVAEVVQAALLPVVRLRQNRDALLRGRGVDELIEKFGSEGIDAGPDASEGEGAGA